MSCVVFVGPTLSMGAASDVLPALYLPPAAQGDVYRVALQGPRSIAIIDGYFQGVPAVWHKEILWALAQGIHVFGSASMGALRAAELAAFGMRGVGKIFESYRDGSISDDDEVALIHGPSESNYVPGSEPLVNMRATFAKAVAEQVLSPSVHDLLLIIARELFYWDRNYSEVIARARSSVGGPELEHFSEWLQGNRVDQKRIDALEMLEQMRDLPDEKFSPAWDFECTSNWQVFEAQCWAEEMGGTDDQEQAVLDELRMDGERYPRLKSSATATLLGLHSNGPDPQAAHPALAGVPASPISSLASDIPLGRLVLDRQILEQLRAAGDYQQYAARAGRKKAFLTERFAGGPEFGDLLLDPDQVIDWYFQERCRAPRPKNIGQFAAERGFENSGEFCRMLLHELLFVKLAG